MENKCQDTWIGCLSGNYAAPPSSGDVAIDKELTNKLFAFQYNPLYRNRQRTGLDP